MGEHPAKYDKQAIWTQLYAAGPRPDWATYHRMHQLKPALWNNAAFWHLLMFRHGLADKLLSELDAKVRDQAITHFWSAVESVRDLM